MKKTLIIPCVLILLFSCQKEVPLNGSDDNRKQIDNAVGTGPSSNTLSSCYNDFLSSNYNALKQSNNIPIAEIANSYWTASIESNYETLVSCGTVVFANDRNIRNLEAVAPPSGPTPTAIYTDPTSALNFLKASYYFGNTSITYMDILLDALDYANNSGVSYGYVPKMMAIAKGIYELGYGNIYASQAYHGDPDPLPAYVYHAIEILAGKYAMTSEFYNTYIARSTSGHISFPVVKYYKGFTLMESDDYIQSVVTGPFYPVLVNVQITTNPTLMYYVTDLTTLMTTGIASVAPNQTSVYYQSTLQEFFTNSSMVSHIPNGYYYLPHDHDEFQRNNYMIEIENGKIKTVLGI